MAERHILFNDEMVRAILDGRKIQTRRPVLKRHLSDAFYPPDYAPGELLYVCETWALSENVIYYRADEAALLPPGAKWSPPGRMPKWAARIWLRVTRVRVERVKDITADGVRAEGFPCEGCLAREAYHFSDAWEAAYPGSWERNDWVWVYEFERTEAPR